MDKFNKITNESSGCLLCIIVDKPISLEGYTQNFLPRAQQIIEEYGELRLLVDYEFYQGWEEEAARLDMANVIEGGKFLTRIALINPPDRVVFQVKLKEPLLGGEIRIFNRDQLAEAMVWVKEGSPSAPNKG